MESEVGPLLWSEHSDRGRNLLLACRVGPFNWDAGWSSLNASCYCSVQLRVGPRGCLSCRRCLLFFISIVPSRKLFLSDRVFWASPELVQIVYNSGCLILGLDNIHSPPPDLDSYSSLPMSPSTGENGTQEPEKKEMK